MHCINSLIHHLIIDYGLDVEIFYKNISNIFENILLEFPNADDPMVQLLIRKKMKILYGIGN